MHFSSCDRVFTTDLVITEAGSAAVCHVRSVLGYAVLALHFIAVRVVLS